MPILPLEYVIRPPECEYEQIKQKLLNRIDSLEEDNAELKVKIHKEILRGDQWRDEKLELQKESDETISNLKEEIQRLQKALEHHVGDEDLVFALSEKLGSVGRRL